VRLGTLTVAAPTTVAAVGEVVVDDLREPSRVVDDGRQPGSAVTRALAEARARRLYRGQGSL